MPNTYRYSHHARRALSQAVALVREFHHPRVDTGHLLVGVLLTHGSIGHTVLTEINLSADDARPHLQSLILPLPTAPEDPPNDAALDAALALAADESSWLGHHYIGTEHLLLGITRTNVGNASDLMHLLGVAPDQVRHHVRIALDDGMTEYTLQLVRRSARLSELSRRVITAAEQEALARDDPTIGISHLLLVLIRERRSSIPSVLEKVALQAQRIDALLRDGDPDALHPIDTVMLKASDQARALGSHFTGTEHLLLALTTEPTGIRLLSKLGVSADDLRDLIARQLVEK
jgi:ATP-dependent Clp protease ATP-binding subunit ClpA